MRERGYFKNLLEFYYCSKLLIITSKLLFYIIYCKRNSNSSRGIEDLTSTTKRGNFWGWIRQNGSIIERKRGYLRNLLEFCYCLKLLIITSKLLFYIIYCKRNSNFSRGTQNFNRRMNRIVSFGLNNSTIDPTPILELPGQDTLSWNNESMNKRGLSISR